MRAVIAEKHDGNRVYFAPQSKDLGRAYGLHRTIAPEAHSVLTYDYTHGSRVRDAPLVLVYLILYAWRRWRVTWSYGAGRNWLLRGVLCYSANWLGASAFRVHRPVGA
jgi:hypothetical protein